MKVFLFGLNVIFICLMGVLLMVDYLETEPVTYLRAVLPGNVNEINFYVTRWFGLILGILNLINLGNKK